MKSNTAGWRRLTCAAIMLLALLGSVPAAVAHAAPLPQADGGALTDDALANATYAVDLLPSGSATLVDGGYEEPVEGTDAVATAWLLAPRGWGDIDGDGVEDAAVILVANGGGSGNFVYLKAVRDNAGVPEEFASLLLGDRVGINRVTVEDGAIVVNLVQQGPDDPMCCPTQHVVKTIAFADGELTQVAEEDLTVAPDEGAQAAPDAEADNGTANKEGDTADLTGDVADFDPDADASTATINLGGAGFWLDPFLVSVISGAGTGEPLDASLVSEACSGAIPPVPDVVLDWGGADDVAALRFFLLSNSDPTLAVVTPAGDILCNDDFDTLTLDPYVEIAAPESGRYAIFVGNADQGVIAPALLVMTSGDATPATFEISALLPHAAESAAPAPLLPESILQPGEGMTATVIAAEDLPLAVELTAGGAFGAWEIELNNPDCTGYIDSLPSYTFAWEGDADLNLFFEAVQDTSLVVRDPTGAYQCASDAAGTDNLNPALLLGAQPGIYDVWVGSYAPDTRVDGMLTISADAAQQPAPLTSDLIDDAADQ